MSNSEKEKVKGPSSYKVQDRRRFDGEGEVRPDAEEEQPTSRTVEAAGEELGAVEEAPAAESPEVVQLREELEKARRRVDELARAYQAIERDREEFKQRLTRERERMVDVERGNAARMVLEAVDELDRAITMAGDDASPLGKGVKLIRESMLAKLQSAGIERLQVVGQRFDPNTAEAADMELTTSEDEDQRVVAETRAGYKLKDRVIRPAQVKVAKYVAPAQA
ncbi:MAG: nucleotide exchange factor GrpE [Myxococcaceae bacterium]|nr:nucleotide exchange factor GrpE [Myxococcaceae bacterium]MCI0670102.1 nucleotide exchange factor GrpE [Myxococcaceae bacterium]